MQVGQGFTMLPEPAYHRREHNPLSTKDNDAWVINAEDLRRADLRIGCLVAVKRCSAGGPGMYRLSADFGGGIGIVNSYLSTLPRFTTVGNLPGRSVLGAVYPIWNFGKAKYEVVIAAVSSRPGARGLPDVLVRQFADPSRPRVLPGGATAERLYEKYNVAVRQSHFKFEPMPEYAAEEEWSGSLQAWLQGKEAKSLAILNRMAEAPPPWVLHGKKHRHSAWIRVVDDEPTQYQQWEVEAFRRIHVPLMDETVYLLPRKYLSGIEVPDGDMVIFDDTQVMINGYANQYISHSAFYDTAYGHNIKDFLGVRAQLTKIALRHASILAK